MNKIQQKKIVKVNELLLNRFGQPPRNKNLPDPVEMLVATILSQNTNDRNSYQAYKNLKEKYPSWEEMAAAKRASIEKEIRIAGLGLQKSAAIKNFLTELKVKQGVYSLDFIKKVSHDDAIREMTSFKGVGVKTASCVLLFALGENICPVDTHVHRTVNRLGIVNGSAPDKTFWALNDGFPEKIAHSFHTNLIRLGREICTPKNPGCGSCPLEKLCVFEGKDVSNKKELKERAFMLLDSIDS
ncbi:MAG: endonuclease III [Bacteroidetes bacterium]|nr:endonuclease III [Bacteroidota bacterium]